MSASQINWAILGTSNISRKMAKATQEANNGRLLAIGSRSLEKAQTFAQEFSVPKFYDDFDLLLADVEIDALYLGLPNHLHKEWIIRAAAAGKHILCEKPFVTNLQEAQDALSAVKRANVFCMEALMYRCHPLTEKLCELMRTKVLGEIRFFNAVFTANIAKDANPIESDCILNLGCYPVSLIRLLAGCAHGKQTAEPDDLISLGEIDPARKNIVRASVLMQFPMHMQAAVSVADDLAMYTQFDIYGTEGYLRVLTNPWMAGNVSKILIKRNDQQEEQVITVNAEQSLYSYQIDFVSQHIQQGRTNAENGGVTWLDSLGNTIVLEAWRKQVEAKNNKV